MASPGEFERWFSGSQIIAPETGEPLVVFHGTELPFDGPFRGRGNTYLGIYATADRSYAEQFGQHVFPLLMAIRRPLMLDLDDAAALHYSTPANGEIVLDNRIVGFYRKLDDTSKHELSRRGYDGIVATYKGVFGFEVVAFEPEQVWRAESLVVSVPGPAMAGPRLR